MKMIVGIFASPADADRALQNLQSIGLKNEDVNLFVPGGSERELNALVTAEAEQPGIGKAFGGLLGGALGAAGGMSLGAAAASILVPGVGPVLAIGVAAAALIGTGGALGGAALGDSLEESLTGGRLPTDELFVYEDALRKGRTVLILRVEDDLQEEKARQALLETGVESVDAAREQWWIGLRDAEEEQYTTQGGDFRAEENLYRNGFEAAQHWHRRGRTYEDALDSLGESYATVCSTPAFRAGYERGQKHWKQLNGKYRLAGK